MTANWKHGYAWSTCMVFFFLCSCYISVLWCLSSCSFGPFWMMRGTKNNLSTSSEPWQDILEDKSNPSRQGPGLHPEICWQGLKVWILFTSEQLAYGLRTTPGVHCTRAVVPWILTESQPICRLFCVKITLPVRSFIENKLLALKALALESPSKWIRTIFSKEPN